VLETLSMHAAAAIEAARLHADTAHASEHDALTRLPNRRRLEADLSLECDRAVRYGRPLSFVMLDLDNFKLINDTHGHGYGDEVLQGVADVIAGTLRTTDTAYRYGGEELAVLVRESDLDSAMVMAERLRAAIEAARFGPSGLGVTASIGVAELPSIATSPRGLVAAADLALYAAKQAGRNRVIRATSDPAEPSATSALPV
jgi:diguanylate cyclase (GGDEF)-like protein